MVTVAGENKFFALCLCYSLTAKNLFLHIRATVAAVVEAAITAVAVALLHLEI